MKTVTRLFAILVLAAVSGCAATVNQSAVGEAKLLAPSTQTKKVGLLVKASPAVEQSKDWQTFRAEWRTAMAEATAGAGLPFVYFDADVPASADPLVLVRVHVNDYRYLTSGARYGFGVMTGNAYIDADAEFVELPANRVLGGKKYATSSSAWEGIFSAMTDKQLRAVANEIVNDLTRQ